MTLVGRFVPSSEAVSKSELCIFKEICKCIVSNGDRFLQVNEEVTHTGRWGAGISLWR